MKTLRTLAKIMTVALILSLVFSFAACSLLQGSLKLEAFVVDRSSVKTVYFIGEEIDFSGIKATVRYSDESLNTEYTIADLTISYDDDITATVGTKQVKVSFMDPHLNVMQETIVQITVKEDPNAIKHDSFAVDASGMKTTYFVGDTVDFTGVKIVEKFTNGGADVEMTDMSLVTYEFDAATITATVGTHSITVKYNGESAGSISITVKKPAITSSELITDDVTLEYLVGATVSFDGLKAAISYENGQTATVTDFIFVTDLATLTANYGTKTVIVKIEDAVSGTTVNKSFEVKVDGVVDYILNTEAVKLSYLIGDTVSLAGLTVTEDWYFAENVNVPFESLSFDLAADVTESAGQKVANVYYNGNVIGSVTLEVKIPNVQSVELNTAGITTEYLVGDTASISGLTALITYENGLTKTVDTFTAVTDLATLTAEPGNKNVIVSYVDPVSGHTANGTIAIKVDGIVSYTVDTSDMTLEYLEGDTVSFEGIKAQAVYYYGNIEAIEFASLTFVHDADLTATSGNKTVTVKVGDIEIGQFIVKVGDIPTASANLENVDISYRVGESVSLDGLTLTLTYNDGTPAEIVTNFEILTDLAGLTATAGNKTIVVKYLFDGDVELRAQFDITVHGFTYQITDPTKTEYIAGDELDYAGLKVEKVYTDDGENVLVTEYTLDDADVTATAGTKTILVKVGGIEIGSITVNVKQNVVTSEVVAGVVSSVRLGSTVDFSGITLTVTYLNGTTVVLTEADLTITHDLTTAGVKNVSVSYYDAVNNVTENYSFTITVYGVDHYSVDATGMKPSYIVGQTVNYDGIKVYAHYLDGGEPVLIDASKLSFDDEGATATAGNKTILVYVDGVNTNVAVNVTVLKNAIEKVELSGYETRFELGSDINFDGLKVTITYRDDTVVVLGMSDFGDYNLSVSGYNNNKEGKQTVSVSFSDVVNGGEGYNTTFEIEVFYRPTISAVEKPDTLTAFESDNKDAGTLQFGQTGFQGQFLNKTELYVIGDDNEFKFIPTVTIDKNGIDTDLDYFYADVDIYIHNGTDYVLLTKTALNKTTYAYTLGDVTYVTVDTYHGNYKFECPIDRVKISVKPSATDYKATENFNPVVLEAKVVDAFNVYEAWGLALFENYGLQEWNDFKANHNELAKYMNNVYAGLVLHSDIHVSANDVPQELLHVLDHDLVYWNPVSGEKVTVPAGTRYLKDLTYIYSRYATSDFKVYGNFFSIDTKNFPLVASKSVSADPDGIGLNYGGDYSNAALFRVSYDVNRYSTEKAAGVCDTIFENVSFIGNAARDNWVVDVGDGSMSELVTAGGLLFARSEKFSPMIFNNVITNSFYISYLGDFGGHIVVNDSKIYDSYQNAAFTARHSYLEINNSFISGTGGPVIITQGEYVETYDGVTYNRYFNPTTSVNGTVMDSALMGDEVWFKAVNATALVDQIKAIGTGVDMVVNGIGTYIDSLYGNTLGYRNAHANIVDATGKMNIKGVLMPSGDVTTVFGEIGKNVGGSFLIDGEGIDRNLSDTNMDWASIYYHPAYQNGAPIVTAIGPDGVAQSIWTDNVNFYDMAGNPVASSPNAQAIFAAFSTADELVLHYNGLSVIFKLYH